MFAAGQFRNHNSPQRLCAYGMVELLSPLRLDASAVAILPQTPGRFLASHWSSVYLGSLKTLVLISSKESVALAKCEISMSTSRKTRQAKDESSSSCHVHFYVSFYRSLQLGQFFTSTKVIRTMPQLRIPGEVILNCGKLTFKTNYPRLVEWYIQSSSLASTFTRK